MNVPGGAPATAVAASVLTIVNRLSFLACTARRTASRPPYTAVGKAADGERKAAGRRLAMKWQWQAKEKRQ